MRARTSSRVSMGEREEKNRAEEGLRYLLRAAARIYSIMYTRREGWILLGIEGTQAGGQNAFSDSTRGNGQRNNGPINIIREKRRAWCGGVLV